MCDFIHFNTLDMPVIKNNITFQITVGSDGYKSENGKKIWRCGVKKSELTQLM